MSEEAEYYRALRFMYQKQSDRRIVEELIDDVESKSGFVSELNEIKTVEEFLSKLDKK